MSDYNIKVRGMTTLLVKSDDAYKEAGNLHSLQIFGISGRGMEWQFYLRRGLKLYFRRDGITFSWTAGEDERQKVSSLKYGWYDLKFKKDPL